MTTLSHSINNEQKLKKKRNKFLVVSGYAIIKKCVVHVCARRRLREPNMRILSLMWQQEVFAFLAYIHYSRDPDMRISCLMWQQEVFAFLAYIHYSQMPGNNNEGFTVNCFY
jgi:hypothetical protein